MSFARFTLFFAALTFILVQISWAQDPVSDPDSTEQTIGDAQPVGEPERMNLQEPPQDDEPLDTLSYPRMNFSTQPKAYIVGRMKATGLKYADPMSVLASTGLASGDTIMLPSDRFSVASRRLWDQRLFADIRVVTDFREDTVDVNFILKERARVVRWQFSNIKNNQIKDLTDKLKLKRGSEYSEYLMYRNLNLIRDYYNEKAFRNAEVVYRVDPDSILPGHLVVTFDIERNKRVRIKEFKFEGNQDISSKKLEKSFKKTYKVSHRFWHSFKYKEENFDADRDNLLSYYRSEGYRDAELLADSLYDVNPKRIGIWIDLKEGRRYYFRDVSWIGNSEISTARLESMVPITKGAHYDSETLALQLGTKSENPDDPSVSNLYQDTGYLASEIYASETVIGDSVDLEIRIIEGKKFILKNIMVEGNVRTNDHVIRRELRTLPGDIYSRAMILQTYSMLSQMQQFEPMSTLPQVLPNAQQNTVDLKYSLSETPNDQLELSGGWGGGMFIASVGIRFTNVSLRKIFDRKAWRPYPAGDNQTLGLSVQSNGSYYRAMSVNFTEPWLGGRKPISLTVNFFTSRETNAYMLGSRATKHFGTIGGGVSIGKRLNWPDPFFTIYYGVQVQSYNLLDWDYFIVKTGRSNVLALNLSLGRNSIDDNYQYATRGSDISLAVSATPPYSLFDGLDYSGMLTNQKRYRWIEYHKWKFNGQWYTPLTRNNKLVLMARAQFGYLGHYNKHKESPFEGFEMGGDGLSGYTLYGAEMVGLRGYSNGSLTPYTDYGIYANIFSKYIAEMRYPVVQQGGTMVYVLGFIEAGNAFRKLDEFKPFTLKRSAGVGLRLYLPILGMLGIDWGYGFDQTDRSQGKASGSNFHFTMGQQF